MHRKDIPGLSMSIKLNTIQKIIIVAVVIGMFLFWDNMQYKQCSQLFAGNPLSNSMLRYLADKNETSRTQFCIKRIYGIDTTSKPTPSFEKLFEDIKALFPFLGQEPTPTIQENNIEPKRGGRIDWSK